MRAKGILAAALLATIAVAATAATGGDVKAGVDAWQRGDFKAAVAQWRDPAIAGDADAQFNMGQAYKLGRGVPIDPAQAESWFRKAAEQGHAQAGDNYALALFQAGRRAEALPWLEKSVARGEPRCQLVLGTMLFNGDGVPRDYPRAYALMSRASAAGLPSASETLAQMDQYISPVDREQGTRLAQQYAATTALRPVPGTVRTVPIPASVAAPPRAVAAPPRPTPATAAAPRPAPLPTPAPAGAVAAAPVAPPLPAAPAPVRPKPVAPAAALTGGWSAQIGAFRDRGNADQMWAKMRGKFPGAHASYADAGGVTRLRASGYASKAAAQAACRSAGVTCIIVAP